MCERAIKELNIVEYIARFYFEAVVITSAKYREGVSHRRLAENSGLFANPKPLIDLRDTSRAYFVLFLLYCDAV